MSVTTDDMDLNARDTEVLESLTEGRANPLLLRERTGLDKGDMNTVLNKLARGGFVRSPVRGLYEITPAGRAEIDGREGVVVTLSDDQIAAVQGGGVATVTSDEYAIYVGARENRDALLDAVHDTDADVTESQATDRSVVEIDSEGDQSA